MTMLAHRADAVAQAPVEPRVDGQPPAEETAASEVRVRARAKGRARESDIKRSPPSPPLQYRLVLERDGRAPRPAPVSRPFPRTTTPPRPAVALACLRRHRPSALPPPSWAPLAPPCTTRTARTLHVDCAHTACTPHAHRMHTACACTLHALGGFSPALADADRKERRQVVGASDGVQAAGEDATEAHREQLRVPRNLHQRGARLPRSGQPRWRHAVRGCSPQPRREAQVRKAARGRDARGEQQQLEPGVAVSHRTPWLHAAWPRRRAPLLALIYL